MGVVNVTPDSFSDGGRYLQAQAAIAHGLALVQAGAELLDVGGESTRSGAAAVAPDEELRRVIPVIEGLKGAGVPISIDTSKAQVATAAVEAGAVLVNDVTALQGDPAMGETVARLGVPVCLMHMQGTPRTMQAQPRYGDVVAEVRAALAQAVARAKAAGIAGDRILVDPGIGFGKTFEHNWALLKHLGRLRELGAPIVLGTSRKAFLGAITGREKPEDRAVATAATVAVAASQGTADVFRVHDVAAARDAVAVGHALRTA
ncbi:MAG: dihydropteroate synthase [Myxococcaceae bacterium]|nr:dihydropteroate synthase [Myxococcaceae bacterium]